MPSHGSPVRLPSRLSLSSLDSVEPRDRPGLVVRQVSLVPPTQLLTASVAPSPTTFLPQSAQTISLRALRVGNSFMNKSPAPVTTSPPFDRALVAGTISALVAVGGLVGAVCYGKKRPGRMKNDKFNQVKVRKKTRRKRGTLLISEDVEANHGHTFGDSDGESYLQSFLSVFDVQKIKQVNIPRYSSTSYPSTPQDSTPSCTPILEHSVYLPWNTYENLTPMHASPSSTINANTLRAAQSRPDSGAELKINESDGVDIGAVELSSLREVVGLPGNNHLERSDSFLGTKNWGAKMIPCQLDHQEAPAETTVAPQLGSIVFPSLVQLPPEVRNRLTMEKPDDSSPTTVSPNVPKDTPKLLELMRFESEIDLRTCLGLDAEEDPVKGVEIKSEIPTVPGLVATNSEDTVTGSDESFDVIPIIGVPPRVQGGKFGSMGDAIIQQSAVPVKENNSHGASKVPLPVFERVRASVVYLRDVPIGAEFTISPGVLDSQVQNQSLLHSGCSSSSASSNSVVTLKLPSFHSPEHALLTKEVLPPTIIVSVPTDGSIRPGSSRGAMYAGSKKAERSTQKKHASLMGEVAARVVYDPADESEDDAWDEAYAGSYFAESTETSARGFDASWVVSSESSDLDLVGKFPLPPGDHCPGERG